jgi:hypothetical protein
MDQRLANWQTLDQPPASNEGLALAQSAPGNPGLFEQGLGMAQRGLEAITPSRDTLLKFAQGLEAAGAVGRGQTPLYLQQQQLDLHKQQVEGAMADRRQEAAARLQQQELARQEQGFDNVMGVMNSNAPWSQKKKILQAMPGNKHARLFSQVGDERLAADFENIVPHIDLSPEDLTLLKTDPDAFVKKAGGLAGLEALIETGKANQKALVEDTAKQRKMQRLIEKVTTNPDAVTETEADELDKFKTATLERQLKIQELKQHFEKGKQDIARGNAPIVSPGIAQPDGQTKHIITDPITGARTEEFGVPTNRQQTEDVPKISIVDAAKVSGLNLAVKDVRALRGAILQPDGTVNRQTLFIGKMFGGLPFTGGKDIDRWIADMVAQKVRLETGATMRPDEKADMMTRFAPKVTDPDGTIQGKLADLEQWHLDAINLYDPTGTYRGRLGSSSAVGAPPQSPEEISTKIKKLHPEWTKEQIMEEMYKRGIRPQPRVQ